MLHKLKHLYLSIGKFILKVFNYIKIGLKKIFYWGFLLLVPLFIVWIAVGKFHDWWDFRDKDSHRGAAAIIDDRFDKDVLKENISYLPQNWKEEDSLWFYRTTQGSNLLPYDFFLHLEQAGNTNKFRDNKNLNNKYRYLPQDITKYNPDALPVGMAKDTYAGKEYLGFTCAACHTSQINYMDSGGVMKAFRIDGGPAAADMENFLIDLAAALEATKKNQEKLRQFHQAVLAEGNYKNHGDIDKDLEKFALQIRAYTEVNSPVSTDKNGKQTITHYGFARLDAFGRIYNRVLQYLMDHEQLGEILEKELPPKLWNDAKSDIEAIFRDEDQTHLVLRVLKVLTSKANYLDGEEFEQVLKNLRSKIYNPANAPASYPYLWDIAQHDYVQWTGLVSNGGIGPLGRNVGQVIGVFGTLDWQKKPGFSISSYLGGQGFEEHYVDFKSSIDKRNLGRVENQLRELQSPDWPVDIWPIDRDKAYRGEEIFQEHCASCHANIDRADPERRIVANISKLSVIKTDPVLAENSVSYKGYSGLIEGEYVEAGPGQIVIEKENPVGSLVKFSTRNVVTSWDPDKWSIRRAAEWAWDFFKTLENNSIKTTLRRGDYDPATTVDPSKPLRSYKARSLNGIWATAPYLHNGSVPNLYELLLPKWDPGDPEFDDSGERIEYRSDIFKVGSREFDPEKVGFRMEGYDGFHFDTSIPGNSNQGHEYGTEKLSKKQRDNLLEYLKILDLTLLDKAKSQR